jgi:hypothetical protein
VVSKRVYFSPRAASRSAVGVLHGPPNALEAPKPMSSSSMIRTFGAPAGGRSGRIGANFAAGSLASYNTVPEYRRSGIGSTPRWLVSGLSCFFAMRFLLLRLGHFALLGRR